MQRMLVSYLGECLLRLAPESPGESQKMIIACAYDDEERNKAWRTTKDGIEEHYENNSEEADTRVWLHVKQSARKKKLVCKT